MVSHLTMIQTQMRLSQRDIILTQERMMSFPQFVVFWDKYRCVPIRSSAEGWWVAAHRQERNNIYTSYYRVVDVFQPSTWVHIGTDVDKN